MSGPRPLKALLAAWNPKGGRVGRAPTVDQATAAFAAAWERAVGSEIARRSRPTKFSGGALTVLTASSAWSDELSLLAPRIIEALQPACPDVGLRKLRFMVASGRTKLLLDGGRSRGSLNLQVRAPAAARPPDMAGAEGDLSVSIARLAALQKSLDAERDRAGWKVCTACQRRFLPGLRSVALCAPCAESATRSAQAKVERALMQAPWLSAEAIQRALPHAKASAYERVRQRLLTRWQFDIAAAEPRLRRGSASAEDRVAAWSYLMLLTGLPQRDVGRAVVSDVLGRDWAVALFGDDRAHKEEARQPPREKHKR